MSTHWEIVDVRGTSEIPGLPGVRLEELPIYGDSRGTLHELFREDEIPAGFEPVMACSSWSGPGIGRGPHQHVGQDDYFTFAGPSDFTVFLWDDRLGAGGSARGWRIATGAQAPSRLYVPRGVVHAYRNDGSTHGLVVTVTNLLFRGKGKQGPVDEIRHELNPQSPYKIPNS